MSKIVGLLLLLLPVLHSFALNIKYMLKYQISKISMTMVTHNENQTVTVPRLLLRQLCRLQKSSPRTSGPALMAGRF